MVQPTKNVLSDQVTVEMVGKVPFVNHSPAYDALMVSEQRLTKQQREFMQKETEQIAEARRDPAGFIERQKSGQQVGDRVHDALTNVPNPEQAKATAASIFDKQEKSIAEAAPVASTSSTSQHKEAGKPTEKMSLEHAQKIFAEAKPEDLAASMRNLEAIQARLIDVPYMTPEYLAQAQQRAYIDEAQKLETINTANHKKANALTWEVGNYSQAPGKTMINGDMTVSPATQVNTYGADIHHGINGKPVGLDLAEINAGGSINDSGNANLHAGVRGVKLIHTDGTHKTFVAGSLDATVSGVENNPKLGGSATALLVNTHQLAGRPTSEIAGAVVDFKSGNVTGVASMSQTFNADTAYPTTGRVVGTYDFKSEKTGFSLEAYQQTGLDGLIVRASANVSDVGGSNDIGGNLGLSYQY
jgi:hypothetical protein